MPGSLVPKRSPRGKGQILPETFEPYRDHDHGGLSASSPLHPISSPPGASANPPLPRPPRVTGRPSSTSHELPPPAPRSPRAARQSRRSSRPTLRRRCCYPCCGGGDGNGIGCGHCGGCVLLLAFWFFLYFMWAMAQKDPMTWFQIELPSN